MFCSLCPARLQTVSNRSLGMGPSSMRIAFAFAARERCMYRCVVLKLTWPASSWIAFAVAPCIAKREQKVCRKMCSRPVTSNPARRFARRIHLANASRSATEPSSL